MTAPALRPGIGAAAVTETLAERVEREQRALRSKSLASLAGVAVATLAVVGIAAVLLLDDGRWMSLPRVVPLLVWALAAAAVALLVRAGLRRFEQVLPTPSLAGVIEREQSLRAGSLRGALEVSGNGALGARAAQEVARRLSPTTLAPKLGQRLTMLVAQTALAAVVALAIFVWTGRANPDGFAATLHPIRAWRGTLLPGLGFDRIPASVPRGMPVTVAIRAEGRETIVVSRRAAGEAWRDTTLSVSEATGVVRLALGPVRAPVTLRVSDGRAMAAVATIAVADRGWIGDVALFAQYPAYLGRTNETLEPVPPLRVPRGTRVRITATLRGGARDAAITDGRDTVRFLSDAGTQAAEGAPVTATIALDRDSRWTWVAAATPRAGGETLPPELPDVLAFTVVPDRAPEVIIRAPVSDTAIGTTGLVPVMVAASDDHGVRTVSLSVWRERAASGAGKRERIEIADPASPMFEGGATISLDGRDLEPGDKVYVVAVAVDDSPWGQTTQSPAVILRVPSLSEQRSMARDLADSLAARAAQLAAQERKLQQNTSDASRNRELKGGQNGGAQANGASKSEGQSKSAMSFSAAERTKQLAKEQQQLGARVDSLRQSAKELEDRLKSAGALDTALAARMRDVQRMLREAMTPEMQKQLAELEKSAERLSGTEAQQSLEQLSAQQRQMRDQLEKSAEMLKRAALEGAMSTLRDEAKDLASAQKQLADKAEGKRSSSGGEQGEQDPRTLADRSRALEQEVDRLSKRLDEAGAKPGASRTKAAQPHVNDAADAMQRAAQQQNQQNQQGQAGQQNQQGQQSGDKAGQQGQQKTGEKAGQQGDQGLQDALSKALNSLKDEKDQTAQASAPQNGKQQSAGQKSGAPGQQQDGAQGQKPPGAQQSGSQGPQSNTGQQQGGQQSGGQQGGQQQGGQQGGQQQSGNDARRAAESMDKAAQQLAAARDAQVGAWKEELSQQLDQSINETMQLARQQAELEQRARQQGGASQGMQSEQGALQQGVQQAAERLEQAGRQSSLLSQRSQKAMAEAQRRVQQATQATGSAGQPGGKEQAQNAMKDASEALNQALSSLVRDRERVNSAESASGFTEMMEQLKQLAQQQGSLNGQMQGLQMLPGGANGQQAKQQSRVLARQQREVARALQDVSDADASGRTDALAKEAQTLASQMERSGVDPNVAARQQQLYRRLLDAGRFLEQDERDDQGPREAKAGGPAGRAVDGPQSGRAGSKYAPPTWNELRGLGPEERRLVIEYFRRLNGTNQ